MFGKLKIHDEDYRYEINEMNEIFVTGNEYSTSKVQLQFTIEEVYFVNPKLLLANLDYLQKGKSFKTNYPPPFIFEIHLGKYIPIGITFKQKVKYSPSTETITIEKYKPSMHVWMETRNFGIPMISHCMIEGFGTIKGIVDPIKVIIDNDRGKKMITMGLSLTNYLYFKG